MSIEGLAAAVQDYASMDRAWRKSLEEHPELRGEDYDSKDQLEAETMNNLGYLTPKPTVEMVESERQKPLL